MSESDYRYFKFRAINKYLIDCLVSSRLYFAKPEKLNDPFDCRIDLKRAFSRAASAATGSRRAWLESAVNEGTRFFETCDQSFAKLGVCSFSLDLLTPLMWTHYADEHRGACFLYRFQGVHLRSPSCLLRGSRSTADHLSIQIVDERPLADYFTSGGRPIVSQLLRQEFERFDVNAKFVPVALMPSEPDTTVAYYFWMHLLDSVECIDHERSEIVYHSKFHVVVGIRKLVLLPSVPDTVPAMFRPMGLPTLIFVRPDVASAITAAAFTGVELTDASNYVL
jgi:hypothetical protein